MKLLIRQRVFSWTDAYDIYDESEEKKYEVKAEFLSLTHQIHVYDKEAKEIGIIHQRLFAFLPTFEIEIGGQVAGTIRKKFSLLHPQYEIDCNGWNIAGDFLGWDYNVMNGSTAIMHISKELFHWGDTYVLDFDHTEDEIMGLLLVIAIDAANCDNSNS